MKKRTHDSVKFLLVTFSLLVCFLASHIQAAVTYWDPEGTFTPTAPSVAYTGQTSSHAPPVPGTLLGTWETALWSTPSAGTATPVAWIENTAACFAVGAGATNNPGSSANTTAFTVTMNSPHTVAGMFNGSLNPNSCHVTINGAGTITWVTGNLNAMSMGTSSDGSTASITINVPIAGSTTAGICAEQAGDFYLNGDSTGFAGGTYLGYNGSSFATGVWHYNNNFSFGTSPVILLNCIGGALVTESAGITITNAVNMYNKYSANINTIGTLPTVGTLNLVATPAGVNFSGPWALSGGSGWTGANVWANTSPWGNYTVLNLAAGHGNGDSADLINISGTLIGQCALTKLGSGILELSGDNSAFSGPLAIDNGTVRVGYPTALGCNGAVSTNGTITLGTAIFNTTNTYGTLDLNGYAVDAALVLANSAGFNNGNGGNGALINSNLDQTAVLNAPSRVLAALITSPFSSTTIAAPVTVSVTGGGGSGATAAASLGVSTNTFTVTPLTQKYTIMPAITVSGGGGSGAIVSIPLAAAAPSVVGSAAFITAPGFGYSSTPTVALSGGTTSGAGTKPTVTANNNFQLMGIQITSPGSGYTSQPTISISGTGVDPTGAAVGLISSVTLASSSSIGGPGNIVINSAIGDNGVGFGFTKLGAGTLTLGAVNTYGGATTVAGGKLVGVVGGSCAGSAVEVQTGRTLGVLIPDSTKQWTCAGLTFDDSTTTSEFNFGSVTPSTSLAPLNVTGAVNFNGTPTIAVLVSGSLPAGIYPLMTAAGGLSGSVPTTANLSLPPYVNATLSSDANNLYLMVTADTDPIKWAVNTAGTWDINNSANWKDTTGTTVTYQQSADVPPVGDSVVFDDTYITTSPTVTLNATVNPVAVTVSNSANNYTITGTGGIAGETSLSKQGSGTLELDTVNTYTGGTTIAAPGSLTVGGAGQLGGGIYSAPIVNNGTLNYNSSAAQILSGPISGTGALAQGNGKLILSGANSYGGGTTIAGPATLQIGDGVLDNGSIVTGNIADNGNLVFTSFYPQTYSGNISGGGSFTVNNPTSLTLSGVNSYSGSTIINGGFLIFNNAAPQILSGLITGAGTLVQAGSGTLTLNATAINNYTGGTIINAGTTLSVNAIDNGGFNPTAIPATGTVTLGGTGATLQYTGPGGATLGATAPLSGTGTLDLPIVGTLEVDLAKSGTLTKTSGGTLILAGTSDNASLGLVVNAGLVILDKASQSTAHAVGTTTTVNNGGTLQLSGTGGDQIYSGVNVTINSGGIFDANGLSEGMTSMTLNGTGSGSGVLINSSSTACTITTTAASGFPLGSDTTVGGVGNLTLTGVMTGAHALNYIGSGVLTLSSANTFTGGLNIPAGKTVALGNGAGAGTGTITINGNGILICNVSGNYPNKITTTDSTGVINVNTASGNTALQGDLTGFTGRINCNGGQTLLNVANNQSFPISAAATWNIANGATLDMATPYVTDAASVIINGGGNNAFGCLRLDACNQTGPVLLNAANCTIGNGNAAASTISGVISDGGHGYGFTRTGTVNNTLVLSAANTYTGPTINTNGTLEISGSIMGDVTVTGGTLQLDTASTLASTATLNLPASPAAGAVFLNYPASQTIKALYFGATSQAQGTWGSTTSSASNKNAAFSGNGILTVGSSVILSTNNVILSITNNANGTFTLDMLGTPGSIYYLASSGNVTNAMSTWSPMVATTNTADGNGNWSTTVVSNTGPVFYRSVAINPHP